MDIRDVISLIRKFLISVVVTDEYKESVIGIPQGNGASPVIVYVYLHYVLDNWFDVVVKRQSEGQCYLIRYCDDLYVVFKTNGKRKFKPEATGVNCILLGTLERVSLLVSRKVGK